MNKSIGIFIPVRTTSNRLPNKLLLPLGDTCLFEIACKKISQLPEKYGKYVLTCEEEFIEIARRYNIEILYRNPQTIHIDNPIRVVMGDVEQAKEDYLMFLNSCLAFLKLETILEILEKFEKSDIKYATSVKKFHNWVFNKNGNPINPIDYSLLNTKEIKDYYEMAHCFHIFNKQEFLETGLMLQPNHLILEVPEEETIDVDTKEDFEYAKWKWENL